jgi:hypothetical protein
VGQHIGPVDLAGLDPANLVSLTEDQAARYWPGLAADLGLHDYACLAGTGLTVEECDDYPAEQ